MFRLCILSAFLIQGAFSADGGIPTKEDQLKILNSLEELFHDVKVLVTEEGVATDASVIKDTETTMDRGMEYLAIMEDYAILKISCSAPSMDCSKMKEEIERITREGGQALRYCVDEATGSIFNNSQFVNSATDRAMQKGTVLVDTLTKCSKKPGLQQISCYKKAITSDVFPLKSILLDTMHIHKTGHLEAISIRTKGAQCIDETLTIIHENIAEILTKGDVMCQTASVQAV